MKTPIPVQRDIVRLIDKGLSSRAVGRQLSISHNTVELLRTRLTATGLTQADLSVLDNEAFAIRLGTARNPNPSGKITPDWDVVREELSQRDMTLSLIWEEYRQANHERLADCLCYTQFQKRYKAWLKTQLMSMRQFHKPGDQLFVDFCGRTMPITNPETAQHAGASVRRRAGRVILYLCVCRSIPEDRRLDCLPCEGLRVLWWGAATGGAG